MAYTRKTYRYRNAIEREEYHTGRYGAPGIKREKKKKPTPEQMERVNQHNKEKTARRKLRRWFKKEDLYVTLTYAVPKRPPDMKTAKEHFRVFINQVRTEYRRRGYVLRWLRNIEAGTKNAWHIHIILNRIPDTDLIVARAWEHGMINLTPCYQKGNFRKLAAYITKTPKTEPRLKEASYSSSRNLPLPEPEKDTITRWETWNGIRIPKGFYLDKESYHEGINPVTGYPYREYTLLRIREKEEKDADSGRLYRNKPAGKRKRNRKGRVPHACGSSGRPGTREPPGDG